MPAPDAPGPSRSWRFSEPDLGATSQRKGSAVAKAAFPKAKDTPYRSSTIRREDMMANPDLPPQSPLPSPDSNVVVAGRSHSSFGAAHTGGHSLRSSRGYRQYDIV